MFVLLALNESDTPWICAEHPQGVLPTPQVGNPWLNGRSSHTVA